MRYKKGNFISHANRGMSLEYDLNITNNYYLDNDIACIHKKPTPIQVVRVNYTSKKKAIINEAFFKTPSTTDYNGIYNGKYIDFEAKETNLEYFPLSNILEHQIKHLENIDNNGGIAFIIVRFTTLNETYLITAERFLNYINNNSRKSIPYLYFLENGYEITFKNNLFLDYIEVINKFEKEKL